MKYKTTIELITEAKDKNEAVEIAGEYLSGNIISGVQMKCLSKPVALYNGKVVCTIAVTLALVIVGFVVTLQSKAPQSLVSNTAAISAVQPPLKTVADSKKSVDFKKQWEAKQNKQILDYIKK
jgi:hypothetical protein